MNQKLSRRSFLKTTGGVVAGLPLVSSLLTQVPTRAFGADVAEKDMLKETDAPAKAVQFCTEADKNTKTCPTRAAADKKGQICAGCQLYAKAGTLKGGEVGTCVLFSSPKKFVHSGSWCQSWVKKA